MKAANKGKTTNTDKLKPAELLHIDFKFFDKTSIRGFTSILTIVDARTRKLWVFPGPDKRPPIAKLEFFVKQLVKQKYNVITIRVYEGGELSRSTDFCQKLLQNNITLETTGGFSSCFNGKVERHHQTITNICNTALFDSEQQKNGVMH